MDNLIAANRAKLMVVVMPAGHTRPFNFGARDSLRGAIDEFVEEFEQDVMPYVENNYRVYTDQKHRAVAGLSMGGNQALNIAIRHLNKFAYVGVYSSGIFGIAGERFGNVSTNAPGRSWEEQNEKTLSDSQLRKGLKLLWFATGKDDFLLETSRGTVAMFKKHGFPVTYQETPGAHTWLVWRQYLHEFVPQLFR